MKIFYTDINNLQSPNFNLDRPNGTDNYLFVLFKSDSYVYVDGEYVRVGTGNAIVFDKNSKHEYFPSDNENFLHDFMHFDFETEMERNIFSDIPINQVLKIISPELISEILQTIINEKNNIMKYQTEILSNLGIVFLYKIKGMLQFVENNINNHDIYQKFNNLRLSLYQSPQKKWSIEEAAAKTCFSVSYFKHLYKKIFNISFTQEVISARIAMAELLLKNTNLRVSEIASECGYQNVEHFIRQFKKETDTTPAQFRNKTSVS